jgi:hypothetical protein
MTSGAGSLDISRLELAAPLGPLAGIKNIIDKTCRSAILDFSFPKNHRLKPDALRER